MTLHYLDLYDKGRMRLYEHWRIYALFAMKSPKEALVKIGVSSIIYDRVVALQCGVPYPIRMVLHAPVGERGVTMSAEKMIHRLFKKRNTRGEWFEFDMTNPQDKREFHEVTKAVYERFTDSRLKWDKITPEQLKAYIGYKNAGRKKEKATTNRWY